MSAYEREWRSLEALAAGALESPHRVPPGSGFEGNALRLQCWRLPSFEAHRSWTLFAPTPRGVPCRRITWDRPFDARRFTDPLTGIRDGLHVAPTLRADDAFLPEAVVERILAAAPAVPLVHGECRASLDGVRWRLRTLRFHHLAIEWTNDGPSAWAPLTAFARELVERLEAAFVGT